ncbi:hypothetical protein NW767_15828 [Fusarium falciforme]|nr:hypothetical protein NW767_15828 [Fusarium falciforme]
MTRQAALEMMKDSNNIAGKNYVLIDLRRTDHEVLPTFRVFRDNNLSSINSPILSSRAAPFADPSICRHRASTRPYRRCTACLNRRESKKSSGTAHPLAAGAREQLDGSRTISTSKATAIWRA